MRRVGGSSTVGGRRGWGRLWLALVLIMAAAAWADVIYLKNNTTVEGVIKRETDTQVVIVTDAGTLYIDRADIDRIERGEFQPVEVPKPTPPAPQEAPEATRPAGPARPSPREEQEKPRPLTFSELRELDLKPTTRWMRILTSTAVGGKAEGTKAQAGGALTGPLQHRGYDHLILGVLPRNAGYRLTGESVLLRYSLKLRYFSVMEVEVDRKFQPLRYSFEFLSRREHVRVEGEKKGDKLVLTTIKETGKQTQEVDYPTGYVVLQGSLLQMMASGDLGVGSKGQYKYFEAFAAQRGVDQVEVLREETIPVRGRSTKTFVVNVKTFLPDAPPAEVLYWVAPPTERDPSGRVVRMEPVGAPFRSELVTEGEATVLVGDAVRDLGLRDKLFGAAGASTSP